MDYQDIQLRIGPDGEATIVRDGRTLAELGHVGQILERWGGPAKVEATERAVAAGWEAWGGWAAEGGHRCYDTLWTWVRRPKRVADGRP